MYKLLLFFGVFSTVIGNVCKTGNIINRPGSSQPVYWPSTWTENQVAPILENGQSCSWIVTVPEGYYGKVIFSGKMNDADSKIQTIDTAGNMIQSTNEGMQPYYFPSSKFTIIVSNKSAATFAFKIIWLPFPRNANKYVEMSLVPEVINATYSVYTYGYSTETGISLLAFPQDTTNYYSLRSTLIIEGSRLNGKYVSNLWLLYQTNNQWISSSDSILIVNLEASNNTDTLLIQESRYTKDISQYVELVPVQNSTYTATIKEGNQKSAAVSVAFINETMIDAHIDDAAIVKIYFGSQNDFSHEETYTGAQLKQSLPLSFLEPVVQFIVHGGGAVFKFKS